MMTILLCLAALTAGQSRSLSAAGWACGTHRNDGNCTPWSDVIPPRGGGDTLPCSGRDTWPHNGSDTLPRGGGDTLPRGGGDTPLWILGARPQCGDSTEAERTTQPQMAATCPGYDSTAVVRPFVRPPFLHEGDSIGVVSISSRIDENQLKHALQSLDILRSWGLRLRLAPHLFDRDGGWFVAPDSVRARDLQQMIDNPHLRAILFFRGGYGAVRILDRVELDSLRRNPKWLVGFSDLTTIHAALQHVGVESIHGAMPGGFRTLHPERDTSALWLREALFGRVEGYDVAPHPMNRPGRVRGRLVGGNLSVMHALYGTPEEYDLASEPVILLIEDVGESIHHIDRMMQTLQRSGRLDRIAGLIVGDFTHIRNEERWGTSVCEVIDNYTRTLRIPVLYGLPAGHGRLNVALYMGREVELEVTDAGGSLRFL